MPFSIPWWIDTVMLLAGTGLLVWWFGFVPGLGFGLLAYYARRERHPDDPHP